MSTSPRATVAVLSIGEMGLGIANLLLAHGYRVVTNLEGRSKYTATRIAQTKIEALASDAAIVEEADYVLSIVPPRDALATAKRIIAAMTSLSSPRKTPLYYLDLNAVSPQSARDIASLFSDQTPDSIRFIDGGIIGGPPTLKPEASSPPSDISSWKRPSIPLSGPHSLTDAPISGPHLLSTLNARHLTPTIGSASGLKMSFASTTKGFSALCIQAFTTAHNLGVLADLKREMQTFNPAMLGYGERMVTSMPPKAYRWVEEMAEIGRTFGRDGGFGEEGNIFRGVEETFRVVADETVLGEEKTENRKRGRTIEDVAVAVSEGLKAKRRKNEGDA